MVAHITLQHGNIFKISFSFELFVRFSVIVKFVVQCKFLGVPPFQMVSDNLFCQNEICGSIYMFLSIPYAICFQPFFCMESEKYD